MKNKYLAILLVSLVVGLVIRCGVEEAPPNEVIDENSFTTEPETEHKALLPIEEMPEWIQKTIVTYEARATRFGYINVFMGDWKGETIYFIVHDWSNCFCNHYFEDGELMVGETLNESVCTESKNWVLIYEWYGEYFWDVRPGGHRYAK